MPYTSAPARPPQHTMELAQRIERETGRPRYLVRNVPNGGLFVIQERMPMMGEWFTSDGIRHG